MTEKQYEVFCNRTGDYSVYKDTEVIVFDLFKCDAEKICEELNKLAEENEQLKTDNHRLVNETATVVAEHQQRVLDLIDEKIKEAPHRKCDCSNCVAEQVLMELKKEVTRYD